MSEEVGINWTSPGPVASAFMRSQARVQILNGPVGSGKTTGALIKLVRIAGEQAPSRGKTAINERGTRVPVRQFRACAVRDTYRQLWKTTLPSWFKRVPKSLGTFTGAENAPASHRVNFQLPDGSIVDFQIDFVGIGENAVEDVLRGYEPTAFYLNETDLLAGDVLTYARGRAGRFPDMADGGPTWYGVLADCNAPEFDSWLYQDIFTKSPQELAVMGIELFIQPSGLADDAENTVNLPPSYYTDQCHNAPDWYIERMVKNRPGYSRAGKPVYPDFEDARHVAKGGLRWEPHLPLYIGLDAGGSPAAVIAQRMPNGRWHILDELCATHGTGAVRFGQMLAVRLAERFPYAGVIFAYADPSAAYGADVDAGEKNWMEIVGAKARITIRPAPTNDPVSRQDAVRAPLTRNVDGGPSFLLDPRCTALRVGFNSGYRFRKRYGSDVHYDDRAEKNDYSHPHDALQYVLSGGGEDKDIRARAGQKSRPPVGPVVVSGWNPLDTAVLR